MILSEEVGGGFLVKGTFSDIVATLWQNKLSRAVDYTEEFWETESDGVRLVETCFWELKNNHQEHHKAISFLQVWVSDFISSARVLSPILSFSCV